LSPTGVESAIRQAKAAAGDKDVVICTASNLCSSLSRPGWWTRSISIWLPVLLGAGVRLFDHLEAQSIELEPLRVVDAPGCNAPWIPGCK